MATKALLIEYNTRPSKKPPFTVYCFASFLDLETGFSHTNLIAEKTPELPEKIETPCFAEVIAVARPGRDGLEMKLEEVLSVSEKIKTRKAFEPLLKNIMMIDPHTGQMID